LTKNEIINKFLINKKQECLIDEYLTQLLEFSTHTNLVGRSTLVDPWQSHVLDCLQILPLILNKKNSILDMGTGAGLPGFLLKICGCENVTLVDSNGKKINFLQSVNSKLNTGLNIFRSRLEDMDEIKFDIITSRALSSLDRLFTYSQKFIKKNTVLIFLKGKTVNEEISFAKKKWKFNFTKYQSISDKRGTTLNISGLKKR